VGITVGQYDEADEPSWGLTHTQGRLRGTMQDQRRSQHDPEHSHGTSRVGGQRGHRPLRHWTSATDPR